MKYLVILILLNSVCFAQTDALNRLDDDGKRHGIWLIYLDENLNEIKDSTDAVYCRYTEYYHKFDYFNMGPIGSKKSPLIEPKTALRKNGLKLLHGEYSANYKNGKPHFVLIYKEGWIQSYKEYYEDGTLKTHFDYTKQCCDHHGAYCIYTYDKKGSLNYTGCPRDPKSGKGQ